MSDTSLNQVIQYGTTAERVAFTPDPAVGSQVLYIWYDTDSTPDTYIWDGSNWVLINTGSSTPKITISLLTSGSGATYTVPAGINKLWVRVQGPGGGGGGGDQGAGSGCGAGGGAGGYAEKIYVTSPSTNFTYTIGTGGAGGTAGPNAGSNGSTATVFDSGGTPITGNVGNGGGSMTQGTTLAGSTSGAGGSATGGNVNITGQAGNQGIRWANNVFWEGPGGNSQLGQGGHFQSSGAGVAGKGYGSGGGGGSAFSGTADVAGGDGATGVIIVVEYN